MERVELHDRYPSRYVRPSAEAQEHLEAARAESADPERWVEAVNPRITEDIANDRTEHVMNCADAARAFQSTLEGRPRVADGLREGGLPRSGDAARGGEAIEYTEQWAGRRSERASLTSIEARLADPSTPETSAIVFGWPERGIGHAFNAVAVDGEVRRVDAQSGTTERWPGEDGHRYATLRAIYFAPDGHANTEPTFNLGPTDRKDR